MVSPPLVLLWCCLIAHFGKGLSCRVAALAKKRVHETCLQEMRPRKCSRKCLRHVSKKDV